MIRHVIRHLLFQHITEFVFDLFFQLFLEFFLGLLNLLPNLILTSKFSESPENSVMKFLLVDKLIESDNRSNFNFSRHLPWRNDLCEVSGDFIEQLERNVVAISVAILDVLGNDVRVREVLVQTHNDMEDAGDEKTIKEDISDPAVYVFRQKIIFDGRVPQRIPGRLVNNL